VDSAASRRTGNRRGKEPKICQPGPGSLSGEIALNQTLSLYACLLVTVIVVYMQEAGLADLVEMRVGEARTVLESMQGTSLQLDTIIV
jgi:hypothetical protein